MRPRARRQKGMLMAVGMSSVGLVAFVLGAAFAIGWIVPLAVGVARMRREQGGRGLAIAGGVWGAVAAALVCVALVALLGVRGARRQQEATAFDPATHRGPAATISWQGGFSGELTLSESKNRQRVRVGMADGKGVMRTGTFQPVQYVLKKQDEAGVAWEARAWITDVSTFTLAEGGTQELQLGPPYTGTVKVGKQPNGQPTFSLKLAGSAGETCNFFKAGKQVSAPGFEIIDEEGEKAFSGKFEYG